MTRFLAARNAPLSSVKAVVLTHHRHDHMGNAERLRTQTGAAVLIHHDDRAAAMRKSRPPCALLMTCRPGFPVPPAIT
jgi:glyoxylase-like metal-dependent hydrolase (beta-lactamase superfamily II)